MLFRSVLERSLERILYLQFPGFSNHVNDSLMIMSRAQPPGCRGRRWLSQAALRLSTTLKQRVSRTLTTLHCEPPYQNIYTNRRVSVKNTTLPFHLPNDPTQPSRLVPITLMTSSQLRSHGTHSHRRHCRHHGNVYLTSRNKSDPGVRITRIGLLSNLCMALGKGVGGYMFHSQALVADAYHAIADLVSDFMTLATVSWSLKGPSPRWW